MKWVLLWMYGGDKWAPVTPHLKDSDRLYDPQAGLHFLPKCWLSHLHPSCPESLIFFLLCIGLVAPVPLPDVLFEGVIVMLGSFWNSDSDYLLMSAHPDLRFMQDMIMLWLRNMDQAMMICIFKQLQNMLEWHEASFCHCSSLTMLWT